MQSLLGTLNFACRVIAPGRAFCRRLIASTIGVKKPFHKIRMSQKHVERPSPLVTVSYNGVTLIVDLPGSQMTRVSYLLIAQAVVREVSVFTSGVAGHMN